MPPHSACEHFLLQFLLWLPFLFTLWANLPHIPIPGFCLGTQKWRLACSMCCKHQPGFSGHLDLELPELETGARRDHARAIPQDWAIKPINFKCNRKHRILGEGRHLLLIWKEKLIFQIAFQSRLEPTFSDVSGSTSPQSSGARIFCLLLFLHFPLSCFS